MSRPHGQTTNNHEFNAYVMNQYAAMDKTSMPMLGRAAAASGTVPAHTNCHGSELI